MQLSAYIINFIKMAEARKTTMGHITTEHLKQSRIVLPPIEICNRFERQIEALFEQTINNNIVSKELIDNREFLLPMLMNGQISFKEA